MNNKRRIAYLDLKYLWEILQCLDHQHQKTLGSHPPNYKHGLDLGTLKPLSLPECHCHKQDISTKQTRIQGHKYLYQPNTNAKPKHGHYPKDILP